VSSLSSYHVNRKRRKKKRRKKGCRILKKGVATFLFLFSIIRTRLEASWGGKKDGDTSSAPKHFKGKGRTLPALLLFNSLTALIRQEKRGKSTVSGKKNPAGYHLYLPIVRDEGGEERKDITA